MDIRKGTREKHICDLEPNYAEAGLKQTPTSKVSSILCIPTSSQSSPCKGSLYPSSFWDFRLPLLSLNSLFSTSPTLPNFDFTCQSLIRFRVRLCYLRFYLQYLPSIFPVNFLSCSVLISSLSPWKAPGTLPRFLYYSYKKQIQKTPPQGTKAASFVLMTISENILLTHSEGCLWRKRILSNFLQNTPRS